MAGALQILPENTNHHAPHPFELKNTRRQIRHKKIILNMIWSFLKFFAMMLGILTVVHGFIYFTFVRFIPLLKSSEYRQILLTIIIILGLSFPVCQLLNHFLAIPLTRFLSATAGLWFTVSLYLIMLFILIWIIKGVLLLFPFVNHTGTVLRNLTLGSLLIATLFTGYGFFNALEVKTTNVDVAIKNLPASWESKTILQISDVHLGGVWGSGRIEQITKIAQRTKPEVIVITGDLFDGASGKNETFVASLAELETTKPAGGIYFISGNHERYASYTNSISIVKKANIRLLENDIVNVHGVQFIGIQYPDLRSVETMEPPEFEIEKHPEYKKGRPTVLLYHTPTDFKQEKIRLGDIQRKAYISPETNFEYARSLGVDLQLSGHTHAGQFFPFFNITKKIYNGFHYGLHQVGNFQIYISSGAGTWGPPVRHTVPCEVALLKLHKK